MTTLRYSTSGAKLALAALVAGSFTLLIPVAASAAPAKAAQAEARAAKAEKPQAKRAEARAGARAAQAGSADVPEVSGLPNEPQYTSAVAPAEETDNCVRQRRRLFVDGEGWIVRRVTICP